MRTGDALLISTVLGGTVAIFWAARARRPLAALPPTPPAPEPVELVPVRNRPNQLTELLSSYLSDSARPRTLYTIGPGDTLKSVAAAALGAVGPHSQAQVIEYMTAIAAVPFNLARYGTRSTSQSYPASWLVPGLQMGIRVAFLERNDDAVTAMRSGRLPVRTVDPDTGKPLGTGDSLGTLWLPPVCPTQLGEGTVTCLPFDWADGSSTYNPDPSLLRLLEEVA